MQPLLLQAVQSPDQPQHRMVMKLGSLKDGGRDGSLIVVSRD
ncbi:FAA hydrolase family protein, partial [Xanthomonas oryzae pv. oryzae]